MCKTLQLLSILSLVLNQILVINGAYEPMQSPKKGFIIQSRMGQFMLMKIGDNRVQIDQRMFQSCDPRPLFGFKFSDNELSQLPQCPLPDVPPLIERTFKNVSVNTGRKARFDVMFTGYPKPVITFFKSGIQLIPSERIQISDSLLIDNAVNEDTGFYTMVAQNPLGVDKIDFFVQVDPSPVTPPPNVCPPKVMAYMDTNANFNESYLLIWYKVIAPDIKYKVELFDNTTNTWKYLAIVPENSIMIRNMKCYLSYRFRVKSLSNGCESQPIESRVISVQAGISEAIPNPITIAELLADKVTISWNPPNNECGSPVYEYAIEKQYYTSSEWKAIGKIAANSRQFTDTDIEGTYRYAIKAINGFGESVPFVSTFINPFQLIPQCPKKPEGMLELVAVTRDSVHLKWDQCIIDKDGNYTFQIEKNDFGSQEWDILGNVSSTQIVINQLKCHTEYKFRIKVFTVNCDTVTLESKPILTSGAPEPPPRPVNAILLDANRLNMSFALPPVVCDAPIEGYIIEKQYNNSEEWRFVSKSIGNFFLDLDIGQTFRYRIMSINKYGSSLPLISRYLTPNNMIPQCPKKVSGTIDVDAIARDSVHMRWDHCIQDREGKSIISQVEMSDASNIWVTLGTTSDYQSWINRLKCHTEYKFRIKIFIPNCETVVVESKAIITSGLPEMPRRPISVIVLDKEKLDLKWTAPPIVCDAPIEGYMIEKQYNTSEDWYYVSKTVDNYHQEFNIGQTYRFRIRAINKYGESIPLISKFVTPHDMIPKNNCPQKGGEGLEVVAINRDSVQLIWQNAIQEKDPKTISVIDLAEGGSNVWISVGKTPAYQVIINQLKCFSEYKFRVRVLTPDCEAVTIESKVIRTPGAPDPPPRPINLNMSWNPSQAVCGVPILGYTVAKQYINSEVWNILAKPLESRFQDFNIAQTYRYRITAMNKYGESEPLLSRHITPHNMIKKQ